LTFLYPAYNQNEGNGGITLGWIWAESGRTIPIPGFKTVRQVEENAKAMEFGPLSAGQMEEIKQIIQQFS
jgi:aryl-alcohol dehydrogenase-like predicted oxidoreductase